MLICAATGVPVSSVNSSTPSEEISLQEEVGTTDTLTVFEQIDHFPGVLPNCISFQRKKPDDASAKDYDLNR
jgi:hypothetical protein